MKYKWRVQHEPVGRYRSFETRGWPCANYVDKHESVCAVVMCNDEYVPANVKTGDHHSLILRIADHSYRPFKWRRAMRTFDTLPELKHGLERILKAHPRLMPKDE